MSRVFWIFPHTLLRTPPRSFFPFPSLLLVYPLPPTNGFVGGTFNVFFLTKIWRKMCIYLFCNFSEEFNCKGNVKSMYSDYASGIAFLIKTSSSINRWKVWWKPVFETAVLTGCAFGALLTKKLSWRCNDGTPDSKLVKGESIWTQFSCLTDFKLASPFEL